MIKTVIADRMALLRSLASAGDTFAMAIVALYDTDFMTMVQIAAPAAKSATYFATTAYGDESTNPITVATSAPNVTELAARPRNVTATFGATWDGGDITVTGTDQFDMPQTETIADTQSQTILGVKLFKTVTAISKQSVGTGDHATNTVTVGTGDKLAVVARATQAFCLVGNSTPTAMTQTAYDTTYNGFTPSAAPNGSLTFTVAFGI